MQEAWKFIAWLLGVTLAALIVAVLAMPQFERWRRLRWLRGRRCRYVEARSGNEACWQAWELWPTASAVCAAHARLRLVRDRGPGRPHGRDGGPRGELGPGEGRIAQSAETRRKEK